MINVYSHIYSPHVRKRVDCFCVQFPHGLQCVPVIHLVAPVYVSMQPVHLLSCVCVSPHWPWIHLHYFACALSHMCARLASRLVGSTWHLSAVSLWSCVCIFAAWLSHHHVLRFSCNLHDLLATVGRYRISYGCDFSCDVQFVLVLFCVPSHIHLCSSCWAWGARAKSLASHSSSSAMNDVQCYLEICLLVSLMLSHAANWPVTAWHRLWTLCLVCKYYNGESFAKNAAQAGQWL